MTGLLSKLTTTEAQSDIPTSSVKMQGKEEPKHLYEALAKIGVATYWAEFPDSLTKAQYRRVIGHVTGAEQSYSSGFPKSGLQAICDYFGFRHGAMDTTRDMRERIAEYVGFEYESPSGNIRDFRKDELKQVTKRVIKTELRRRR